MTSEGHLLCEKLKPGDYVIKALEDSKEKDNYPDKEHPAFCFITDDGELICEGLPVGEYSIEEATDEDMSKVVKRITKNE